MNARRRFSAGVLAAGLLVALGGRTAAVGPNIVVILADDLGYGDVGCYNPDRGKIPTPRIDRLAQEGMRFTDAHSSAAICTPSRYAVLTGRYNWRTRLQANNVGLYAKPLIAPDRLTLAGYLKRHGYRTACVGKWHLGWDWPIPPDRASLFRAVPPKGERDPAPTAEQRRAWADVFAHPIGGGPTARGFDTYFGTDMPNCPPFCFIDNDRTQGVPSAFLRPDRLSAEWASVQGPALPGWELEAVLPALADRACAVIAEAAAKPDPFFLYFPLTSPHTPLAVNVEWKGKSGLGIYGDFVMETDAVVGRVLDALEAGGAAGNTLVVFTSDNGYARYDGLEEPEDKGHFPSGPLRGHKTTIYEGGHRVPFVARWPGVVPAGTVCDHLALQADLLATVADALGDPLPADAGEDSVSLMPLLRGGDAPVRESAVSHSSKGLFAVRKGRWKLVLGRGSGSQVKGDESLPGQLYDLSTDLGETRNLYADRPELVAEMTALMEKAVADGRSTPGPRQRNDVDILWDKRTGPKKAGPGG